MSTAESYSNLLLALCVWREARGCSADARRAVKHVILNRSAHPAGPYVKCKDVITNILCPYQFSSFNRTDPNASILPNPSNVSDWNAWLECCSIVDQDDFDLTKGANAYFDASIHPPAWADPSKMTIQIGTLKFFRL